MISSSRTLTGQQSAAPLQAPKILRRRIADYLRTTPGQLTAALVACIIAAAPMAAAAYFAYAEVHQVTQTIGRDTVPSIVAAEHISATLADANADAMNAIMTKESDEGASWKTYRKDMDQAHEELITATRNITYGDEEYKPILTMMTSLGEYERIIGQVRGELSLGSTGDDFLAANRIMREAILPAAAALDQANFSHLDNGYTTFRDRMGTILWPFWFFGLMLLAVLIVTQLGLFRKSRRLFNLGLLTATLVLGGFAVYATIVLMSAENTLVSAKQDAFDSVHALWKARAVAYDANADESLYLLLHGNKEAQDKSTAVFWSKAAKLTAVPPQEALASANSGRKFGGFLGDELANITFPGEREAAMDTLKGWIGYLQIDPRIRKLEEEGQHQQAIELCIGSKPGQSDWAFSRFNEALGRTLDINEKQFAEKIDHIFAMLTPFPGVLIGSLIVIVVSVIFGMKPRLGEYRF